MPGDKKTHKSEMDYLKELILRSGFPLEIEITSFLTEKCKLIDYKYMGIETDILTCAYYLDKDEGKGRELDIKARVPISTEIKKSPMIYLNLLIQCKNIPGNAWVFFKSPHRIKPHSAEYCCGVTSVLNVLKWLPRLDFEFKFLLDKRFEGLPTTTVFDEYILDKNTSNNQKDNLFDAVISLAKATSYEVELANRSYKKDIEKLCVEETDAEDLALLLGYAEIFYPIVIFSGKMYVAEDVAKGKRMKLTPVDHVGLFFNYVSGSYDIDLALDIMTKDAFGSFFKNISRDTKVLRNALNGDIGKSFDRELVKALKFYSSSRGSRQE